MPYNIVTTNKQVKYEENTVKRGHSKYEGVNDVHVSFLVWLYDWDQKTSSPEKKKVKEPEQNLIL